MQIITLAIQKGGTGKTTTAAALAQAAAYKKKKVLAIDLDPQGNLSYSLGADMSLQGSYELLSGAKAADTIQTVNNIDIAAASEDLITIKTELGSANRLKKALEAIKDNYDLIVIDTPPTASELQYNALMASTGLIIPLQADAFNLQSLYQIADTAKAIQQNNSELKILGVLFTMNSDRSTLARQMQDTIINEAQDLEINYLGEVRKGVAIKEAQALQTSLYEYAPKSKPAQDYISILRRIIKGIR